MGGAMLSDQSSLDRLKALASLPDLPSQLAEANRLCTHSARADMIARWLLDQLKSSRETRKSPDAWQCLHSTIRLHSPSRLAILLTSHNFISILQSTLEEVRAIDGVFDDLEKIVRLLLEVSATPSGTPVKAALSLTSETAASILGLWLRNVRLEELSRKKSGSSSNRYSALAPALELWKLRKSRTEEDVIFARECLVPAANLLCWFDTNEGYTVSARLKRKRHSETESLKESDTKELETLLARHIFLPARNAFHKSEELPENQRDSVLESQRSHSRIETILEPLRSNFEDRAGGEQLDLRSLSLLLGIALRCVATPTPRQRAKERPWIETVFNALLECNKTPAGGAKNRNVLIEMLNLVRLHASLARQTLREVVRTNTVLLDQDFENEDLELISVEHWELVAQIIATDADVFSDVRLAETLFGSITKASTKVSELPDPFNLTDGLSIDQRTLTSSLHALWLDQILIPIMKTFAHNRNLTTFVGFWTRQLDLNSTHQVYSVCVELDQPFQSILEDSMNEGQIIELFDRMSGPIKDPSVRGDADEDPAVSSHMGSSIVVLNGILGGLRSESLLSAIGSKCEKLLIQLLHNFDASERGVTSTLAHGRVWNLMGRCLELWFPAWVVEHPDRSLIAAKLCWLLSSRGVISTLPDIITDLVTMQSPGEEAHAAVGFVATLCNYIGPYREELDSEAQAVFERIIYTLFQRRDLYGLQAIARYPTLLLLPDSQIRLDFLATCITSLADIRGDEGSQDSSLERLQSLVATIVASGEAVLLDELLQIALSLLRDSLQHNGQETDTNTVVQEFVAIEVLSWIPVTHLTRAQRENALDVLSQSHEQAGHFDEKLLRSRLALIVKLMQVPNATALLSTDHNTIWRIALGKTVNELASEHRDSPAQFEEAPTVGLCEELAKLLAKHLLATQDQERSHAILVQLSQDVADALNMVSGSVYARESPAELALIRSLMLELEVGAKERLKVQFPYRKHETLIYFCSILTGAATCLIRTMGSESVEYSNPGAASTVKQSIQMLSLAIGVVKEVESDSNDEKIALWMAVLSSEIDTLLRDPTVGKPTRSKHWQAAFVRCFEICCKHYTYIPNFRCVDFALRLMDTQLLPVEMENLLVAFPSYINSVDGLSNMRVIEELLSRDDTLHRHHLLLLHGCLTSLDKDDVSTQDSSLGQQLLPKLLAICAEGEGWLDWESAISCILVVLRDKLFLVSQYGVDEILAHLLNFINDRQTRPTAYQDVCQIMSTLLLNHRARTQGRLHLVTKVFQMLITRLFQTSRRPTNGRSKERPLGPKHAHTLTRAISLFCEPPHLYRQAPSTGLTDESRKEQRHVGQYVQFVLHHYCSQVLTGSLPGGVKDALTPGLWTMIEAIEMNDADGMKSLSAAMTNSERAVLRGVYDDWRRFGKWRGG